MNAKVVSGVAVGVLVGVGVATQFGSAAPDGGSAIEEMAACVTVMDRLDELSAEWQDTMVRTTRDPNLEGPHELATKSSSLCEGAFAAVETRFYELAEQVEQ